MKQAPSGSRIFSIHSLGRAASMQAAAVVGF